jgi:hypothetical protein
MATKKAAPKTETKVAPKAKAVAPKKDVKAAPKKEVKADAPKKTAPKILAKMVPSQANAAPKQQDQGYVVLEHDLLTQNYTMVIHEQSFKFNAPHHFKVIVAHPDTDGEHKGQNRVVGIVDFQEGPIKENGVNGVANEDLLGMVLVRLEHFQNSEYKCRENACAITKIEEALMWLRKRTNSRVKRGVEGTSKV